jgi:copper oxidase (laccase) domain-containing protein
VNVTEMGKVGLSGWRGRAADVVARPIARRSRLDEDEIRAIIGAVFLAYTIYRLVRALYRAARTEKAAD